jgi:hypothetical protein
MAGPVAVIADTAAARVQWGAAVPPEILAVAQSGGAAGPAPAAVLGEAAGDIARAVRARTVRVLETQTSLPVVPAKQAASTLTLSAEAVGFEPGHYLRDSLALYLAVRARWQGANAEGGRVFFYRSSERPVSAWSETAITTELRAGAAELGERIAEALYMKAALSPAVGSACGLQWMAPRRLYRPQLDRAPSEWNRFILLDTRTPTLAWESFSEHARRAGAGDVVDQAREVTYDLRLWQALRHRTPLLVYERQGLTTTEHTLEMPLRAGAKYYWSVRARFVDEDGHTRVTTWSRFRLPYATVNQAQLAGAEAGLVRDPCLLDFLAEPNYYRFATPD